MNLLRDKREEEQFDVHGSHFDEESYDSSEFDEDYQADIAPEKARAIPKKKTPMLFWITLFLLLVAFAVIYFTQFYDKSRTLSLDQFGQTTESQLPQQQEPQSEEQSSGTPEPQQPRSPADEAQTSPPEQQTGTEQQMQQPQTLEEDTHRTGERVVQMLLPVITAVNSSLSKNVTLGTFILDPYSISTEMNGAPENIKAFYNRLSDNLPAYVVLNNLPSITNNSALLSGRLDTGQSSAASVTGVSAGEIQDALNNMILGSNLSKLSLSTEMNSAGRYRVFLKAQGGFDQCVNFLRMIAEHRWNPDVSKLILMPESENTRTLVLRLVY